MSEAEHIEALETLVLENQKVLDGFAEQGASIEDVTEIEFSCDFGAVADAGECRTLMRAVTKDLYPGDVSGGLLYLVVDHSKRD